MVLDECHKLHGPHAAALSKRAGEIAGLREANERHAGFWALSPSLTDLSCIHTECLLSVRGRDAVAMGLLLFPVMRTVRPDFTSNGRR